MYYLLRLWNKAVGRENLLMLVTTLLLTQKLNANLSIALPMPPMVVVTSKPSLIKESGAGYAQG